VEEVQTLFIVAEEKGLFYLFSVSFLVIYCFDPCTHLCHSTSPSYRGFSDRSRGYGGRGRRFVSLSLLRSLNLLFYVLFVCVVCFVSRSVLNLVIVEEEKQEVSVEEEEAVALEQDVALIAEEEEKAM